MRKLVLVIVLTVVIVVVIALTLGLVFTLKSSNGDDGNGDVDVDVVIKPLPQEPEYVPFKSAVVATDSGLCSEVGRGILRINGSTADAAIASMFCVGLINMHSTGIGGGGFMVFYSKKKRSATVYDFREEAPANATEDMYVNDTTKSSKGGLSVAVPAEIKGMIAVHNDHGLLKWERLVEPTIKLAREGFQIMKPVHEAMQIHKDEIEKDPGLRKLLMRGGELKKLGEIIKNPELAETLTQISKNPNSFYNGDLAKQVVKDIKDQGGIVSLEDLKNYNCKRKDAVINVLNNKTILYTSPPPSSGIVLSLILNILKNADPVKMDSEENKTLIYHRITEAFKFGYARRAQLGDPDIVNLTSIIASMTSDGEAKKLYEMIWDNQTHINTSYYGGYYAKSDSGTSHLSILGTDGDAVSVTSTINYRFGARFRSLKTGIIYNDQMDDFSTPDLVNIYGIEPSKNNFIKPGARPLSSISPVVIADFNGSVIAVAGASGGSRITTGTSLVVMNRLWYNMTVADAVMSPRIHHQLVPQTLYTEEDPKYSMDKNITYGLVSRGHKVLASKSYCVVQAIGVDDDGKIWGKSDPRKHGWAAGF